MTGTTGAAWADPARGGELAKAQFGKGADVVFAAAGGTGIGVYQAAKDAGKLAIGVDSNQNHIQPGTMLTSMLKRVDVAVYEAAKAFKPGVTVLGLKEGGVDYAMDDNNAKLVSADMKKKVEAAKADIIGGKVKVADYMALAALIFGHWRPVPALLACLLFGFLDAAAIRLQGVSLPGIGEVPVQAVQALPYLLTVILLAGFIGRTTAPKALGIPYVKER